MTLYQLGKKLTVMIQKVMINENNYSLNFFEIGSQNILFSTLL